MALWPNNFSNLRGFSRIRLFGDAGLGMSQQLTQRQLSFFVNDVVSPTASIPEGSFESRACILAPLVGGAISAGNSNADSAITAAAALIAGAPISGAATLTLTTADAVLSLTIGLTGEATWTLTPTAGLSMIVPVAGAGVLSVSGTADLKGLLAMSGESSSFTELSPESLARAVWSEVIEHGYTAEQLVRLLAALAAGKSSGFGTATATFRDLADSKARLTATLDGSGNRTAVTVDPT